MGWTKATKKATIVTTGDTTMIATTITIIRLLKKVDKYPQIEKIIRRKRKKGPTRRLMPQRTSNTNSSPLPASPLPTGAQMPPCNE